MNSHLQSLVDARQNAISCLKAALQNVDTIVNLINQINRQIETQTRLCSDNQSAPDVSSFSNETRHAEIVPNVLFNAENNVSVESLESATRQADGPSSEPDTALQMTVAVKDENHIDNQQVDVAAEQHDAAESNEQILDSVFSLLSARDRSAARLQPIVRLELLKNSATKKRGRGRPRGSRRSDDRQPIMRNRHVVELTTREVPPHVERLRLRRPLTDNSKVAQVCERDGLPEKKENC